MKRFQGDKNGLFQSSQFRRFSERMSEEKAKAMGIREFAMKPLVLKDLARTIRKVLDGE